MTIKKRNDAIKGKAPTVTNLFALLTFLGNNTRYRKENWVDIPQRVSYWQKTLRNHNKISNNYGTDTHLIDATFCDRLLALA